MSSSIVKSAYVLVFCSADVFVVHCGNFLIFFRRQFWFSCYHQNMRITTCCLKVPLLFFLSLYNAFVHLLNPVVAVPHFDIVLQIFLLFGPPAGEVLWIHACLCISAYVCPFVCISATNFSWILCISFFLKFCIAIEI